MKELERIIHQARKTNTVVFSNNKDLVKLLAEFYGVKSAYCEIDESIDHYGIPEIYLDEANLLSKYQGK